MFTKKMLLLFSLFILITVTTISASTYDQYGTSFSVAKFIPLQGNIDYIYGSYDLGRENNGGNVYIYRANYSFNLWSIPSDAIINSVTLHYSTSRGNGSFKIVKGTSETDQEELWLSIPNGSVYLSSASYSGGSTSPGSLKSEVESHKGSSINIAVYSNNETVDDTYTYVTLRLEVDYTAKSTITARNNYPVDMIKVGVGSSPSLVTAPHSFTANEGQTAKLEAVENQTLSETSGYYNLIWNDSEAPAEKSNWLRRKGGSISDESPLQSYSFTMQPEDDGATYEAQLRKVCNVNFATSSGGGTITVNSTNYQGSTPNFDVIEKNNLSATTNSNYHYLDVDFIFDKWVDQNNNTLSEIPSVTVTPTVHKTCTAKFIGQPTVYDRDLHFGRVRNQPIVLYWNDYWQHPGVTRVDIYRKVNGSNEEKIGSVNRGIISFTDNDFLYTGSSSDIFLQYDVRPYFSPSTSHSFNQFVPVYGQWAPESNGNDEDALALNEVPTEFGLDNYPNPFNPSTSISFAVPEAGNYTLRVFNMLGQEVATLFNNHVSAGKYQVQFDASKLSSGIYIYTLTGSNVNISKKMMLMK